jgi:hypothetical protein
MEWLADPPRECLFGADEACVLGGGSADSLSKLARGIDVVGDLSGGGDNGGVGMTARFDNLDLEMGCGSYTFESESSSS